MEHASRILELSRRYRDLTAFMLTSRFEDPVKLLKALKLRAVRRFGL